MPPTKPKQKSWTHEYLRILRNGPERPDDNPIAAELIGKGFADGRVLPDHRTPGAVANLQWRGITIAGREYADKLEAQIKRSSWLGRLLIAATSAAGVTAAWFWQEILNWLKKQLALGS